MLSTQLFNTPLDLKSAKASYSENGYYNIPGKQFSEGRIDVSKLEDKAPFTVYESNGNIRSCYGLQLMDYYNEWKDIFREVENFIREILMDDIYIHQCKINHKESIPTSVWPWHRDFPYWNIYDNIKEDRMVNLIFYLDNVGMNSGPLQVIPGSHTHFFEEEKADKLHEFNALDGSVSNTLDFELPEESVKSLADELGVVSLCGKTGDMSLFHPNVIHQSSHGEEGNKRRLLIITYNACSNKPEIPSKRPEYFSSTNYKPI
ncbi:MAG: phytanoyl-CoA dioxygenase family protein [Flavobacteriales bacterium]|nr:phytanoyl-CoA dioxygenase family protein [Flavobacteriales bacterium]